MAFTRLIFVGGKGAATGQTWALDVGRWALDVEVIPSIIRGKPRGRLAYFANFAVNSIETNSIVTFAENGFDIP